ncbi:MAG: MOSC domain-containing protein [Bacteroidota bacterium]
MKLSQITIYPIKSTAPLIYPSIEVKARGLGYDRHWALFDENDQLITGREQPKLLDLRTQLFADHLLVEQSNGRSLRIPLDYAGGEVKTFGFFSRTSPGLPLPADINDWFSEYLGFPCRLAYMNESVRRPVLARHGGQEGDLVSFADQAPILLISTASLEDLNRRLKQPVSASNFRSNIIVDGCTRPYVEDEWKRISIGGLEFDVVQGCKRCIFINIDPITRQKGREPLKTLATYRRDDSGAVIFGVHLIPRSYGKIQLHDPIIVIK